MKAQTFLDSKRLPIFHHPLSRSTGNLHITRTSYPSYDHENQDPNLLSPHYQNPITHPTSSRSPVRAYDNSSSPKRIPSDRSENGGLNFQVLEEIIFSLTPPNVVRNVRPSSCREFSRALDKLKEEADPIIFIDHGSTPVSPTRRFSYGSLSEINKLSEKYSVGSYDPVLRSPIIEESSDEVFDYSNKVDGKARRGSGKSLKSLYVPGGVIPDVPDGVTVTKEECIVPEDFLGVSKDYEQPRRPKKEDHRARKPKEFERSYEKRPCLKKAQSTQSIHNVGISHFRTQSSPEPKRSPHTDPEIPSVAYLSKRRVTDTGFLIPSRTTSTLDLRSNGYTKISTIKPKSKSWKIKVGQFFPAMHDRSSAKEKDKRRDSREFYGISPAYAGSIPCLVRQQTTRWKSFVGLPDDLASVLKNEPASIRSREPSDRSPITPNHFIEDVAFFAKISQPPQLEKSKWMDLELWSVEDPSWTAKHPNIKLSTNEKKRQNIINEFYYTEKQHCQMIVFLQQAYQVGLRSLNVLSENELNQLIPDVLDSMLDFHLRLLRKIRKRKADNIVVDKISDVICEEFENGPYTTAAINAYTSFCASREESQKRYLNYLTKSPRFKQFFELQEQNPCAKGRTFKACLLVIASRLTKYPVLVEQIGKYDPPEHKEENKRAHYAVKQFALKVDRELSKIELNRRWDHLRQNLDTTSTGRLLKEPFTIQDLVYQDPADCRKVVSIGSVKMQDVKTGQKVELCMVLFDDIIVLFQDKNGTLQFFKHSDHASVIPLQTLIPREMERSNEIMLVVTAKECPDMYRLIFNNKSEVRQWIQAIKSARETAPRYVRRHGHTQNVESANQMGSENDPNEIAYNENIQKWQKGLEGIFALRKDKEDQLRVYINERMKFFDEVRSHFKKFPAKPIKDPHLIAGTSRAKIERQNRDIEKMKNIVRGKFNELREHRRAALDQLVETAQNARDCDLVSFFDDLHDLSHPENQATSSTSSEENDESRGYRQKKPKRNRTYHGEVDSYEKGSIRRHTTLPKMGEAGPNSTGEEDAETEKQVDEEYRKLPLKMSSKARRAASKLIEENVSLRVENNKLKSEIALQELHIVSLKSRKAPVVETAEKLESLRQKQEEIRELEKRSKQKREMDLSEISLRQKELEKKEALLKSNEENLNKRWHDLLNMEEKQSLNTAHTISPQASFKDGSIVQREKSSPRTSTIYPSLSGSDLHAPIPHHLAEKSKKMIKKDKK